jgi:hypothetical protein
MRHPVKAITLTSALLWGGCMLLVGLINLAHASYGGEFLRMMSSVFPGADTARTLGRVVVGTVYGLAYGAIVGYLFACLLHVFGEDRTSPVGPAH